jgi:hypothetical protein
VKHWRIATKTVVPLFHLNRSSYFWPLLNMLTMIVCGSEHINIAGRLFHGLQTRRKAHVNSIQNILYMIQIPKLSFWAASRAN